jgi:hypothetical protein
MQCDYGAEKVVALPQSGGPVSVDDGGIGSRHAVAIDAEFEMRLRIVSEQTATQRPEWQDLPPWLREVREMRGRIFYEDGRRPFFRRPDLSFDDPDPADMNSYHVIASFEGRRVGYARIAPFSGSVPGFISSTIGAEKLHPILRTLNTDEAHACEASRWVVVPEFRGRLGSWMVAASWAIARWLCYDIALVLACTCQKQDLALVRMGAHAVEGLPLFPSHISDDRLRLLYFDVRNPANFMRAKIADAARTLYLDQIAEVANPGVHRNLVLSQ